jgi:hypothetical protein
MNNKDIIKKWGLSVDSTNREKIEKWLAGKIVQHIEVNSLDDFFDIDAAEVGICLDHKFKRTYVYNHLDEPNGTVDVLKARIWKDVSMVSKEPNLGEFQIKKIIKNDKFAFIEIVGQSIIEQAIEFEKPFIGIDGNYFSLNFIDNGILLTFYRFTQLGISNEEALKAILKM